jgi:hypothetical protein
METDIVRNNNRRVMKIEGKERKGTQGFISSSLPQSIKLCQLSVFNYLFCTTLPRLTCQSRTKLHFHGKKSSFDIRFRNVGVVIGV